MLGNKGQMKYCNKGVTHGPFLRELACWAHTAISTPSSILSLSGQRQLHLHVLLTQNSWLSFPLPIRLCIVCTAKDRLHTRMENVCVSCLT